MLNGKLVSVADKMTCTLDVNTYYSATASTVNWVKNAFDVNLDGGTSSKYR